MSDEMERAEDHEAGTRSPRAVSIALVLAVAACAAGAAGIGMALMQGRTAAELRNRLDVCEGQWLSMSNRLQHVVATGEGMQKQLQAADTRQRALQALCVEVEKQAAALREALARDQGLREAFEEPARRSLAALNNRLLELEARLAAPPRASRDEGGSPPDDTAGRAAPTSEGEYSIQSGDTLEKIAKKYGLGTAEILRANPGVDPVRLRIGQKIRLPAGGE